MRAKILKANEEGIREGAEIIKRGGLVAFPTETVYGLGGNALNEKAVKKIFEAKGRPADNPLIVHVSSIEQVETVAEIDGVARALMDEFFPGPLALVLRKKDTVPSITTGGLDKVAVRMPDNRVALRLIEYSETPVAAPSANAAGKPSPTKAEHVLEDLGEKIDAVIDGGEVEIGIESTVLDLTVRPAKILRPGAIGVEELSEFVEVEMGEGVADRYRHYETDAPIYIFGNQRELKSILENLSDGRVCVITRSDLELEGCENVRVIRIKGDVKEYGRKLFGALRDADKVCDVIFVEGVEEKGIGRAIMHRLKKASYRKAFKLP